MSLKDRPKLRYINGFMIFCEDTPPAAEQQGSIIELTKAAGRRWQELPQLERDRYNERFRALREQHQAELELFYSRNPGALAEKAREEGERRRAAFLRRHSPEFVAFAGAHLLSAGVPLGDRRACTRYFRLLQGCFREQRPERFRAPRQHRAALEEAFASAFFAEQK